MMCSPWPSETSSRCSGRSNYRACPERTVGADVAFPASNALSLRVASVRSFTDDGGRVQEAGTGVGGHRKRRASSGAGLPFGLNPLGNEPSALKSPIFSAPYGNGVHDGLGAITRFTASPNYQW